MPQLPILTELQVKDYGLFPGNPCGSGIVWSFKAGLSLIAGINGLGKTTLLTMIMRCLTGPYDLTSDGPPRNQSVQPVALGNRASRFFAQRVADEARDAEVVLSAEFGNSAVIIARKLSDLSLLKLVINSRSVPLPDRKDDREKIFQKEIVDLMELGNFVDVLLVLHHVVLFHEDRPGALWDINAQRHILRALFLDRRDADLVAQLERKLQSADSQARNIGTRINATQKDLTTARQREAGSQGVAAQLGAEEKLLQAEVEELERFESDLSEIDDNRQRLRLEHERAKIEHEEANSAIERLKYTALLRLFPTMNDAARLVVSRIMTQNRCLVCNAEATAKRSELEELLAKGCCPSCGAEPSKQENVIAPHEFEQAKLDSARAKATQALQEERAKYDNLRESAAAYDEILNRIGQLRSSVDDRRRRLGHLRGQLPRNVTSSQYEAVLGTLKSQQREWEAKRAENHKDLAQLLGSKKQQILAKADQLVATFGALMQNLIAEDTRLVPITAEPTYLQSDRLAGC